MKKAICVFLSICAAVVSIQPLAAKDTKMLKELEKIMKNNTEDEIIAYLQKEKISPGKIYTVEKQQVSLLLPMIASGKYKVVRYLVENGADVKRAYKDGKVEFTPLGALLCPDFGAYNRKKSPYTPEQHAEILYDLARLMIKKGADVKAVPSWDSGKRKESIFGLVMYAGAQIRKHDLSFLQYLIDKGADPHGITNTDRISHKPHSFYFLANNIETALFLMNHNVRPYKQKSRVSKEELGKISRWDYRLRISCTNDLDSVLGKIDALLEVGVKPEELDLRDTGAMSFIVVEYLCRKGADINVIGPEVAAKCDLASLKALVEKGLEVDSTIVWNKQLHTLLADKISSKRYDCCEYLIDKGASLGGDGVERAVYYMLVSHKNAQNHKPTQKFIKLLQEKGFFFSDEFKNQHHFAKEMVEFIRQQGFDW